MKISKLIFFGIVAGLLLSGCSKEEGYFSITGRILHAGGQTVTLEKLLVASTEPVDSVRMNSEGEFEFKGETRFPAYYLLKLSDSKFITLLVDSAEQLLIAADEANFERDYLVEGSEGSKLVRELTSRLDDTKHKLDSLQSLRKLYQRNPDFSELNRKWDQESMRIKMEQSEFSRQFVMDHPFSMASILALYQKFDQQEYVVKDIQTMRVAASALNTVYPESPHVKALYKNTLQMLKEEQSAKLQQLIREKGQGSPDIVLPAPDGKEIALSSLRGQVVLLQFWSAADRGSRILNEALAEAYRKYRNKGFEIYQVSVDENRIEWVDAIDRDGLVWINVGDMEGSITALRNYNIQQIPYNYLLNEEGEIVGKDLKGPALDKALAKILN